MDTHTFKEELGNIRRCDALLADYKDDHLQKPINYHKYTIIALLGGWKARHLIHRNGFPRPLGSRKRGV
jgi:hypothetical protein